MKEGDVQICGRSVEKDEGICGKYAVDVEADLS